MSPHTRDRNVQLAFIVAVAAIVVATAYVVWSALPRPVDVARSEAGAPNEAIVPDSVGAALSDVAQPTNVIEPIREPVSRTTVDEAQRVSPSAGFASAPAYFRVVACNDGAPVDGAVVQLCKSFGRSESAEFGRTINDVLREWTTDTDGRVDFDYPSARTLFVRVLAPGFGPVIAEIDREYATRARPQTLCVERSVALNLQVLDAAGGPIPGVGIRLSARGSDMQQPNRSGSWPIDTAWELQHQLTTDGSGQSHLAGLPANVPLRASIQPDEDREYTQSQVAVLEPGETRNLLWDLGGCRLEGQVFDQEGKPVASAEITLQPELAGPQRPPEGRHRVRAQRHTSRGWVRSDDDGRFVIEDVGSGSWFVRAGSTSLNGSDGVATAVAGLPVVVQVERERRTQHVTLHVHRGVFIEGRVLDPHGVPSLHADVDAEEESGLCTAVIPVRRDGSFRVGPLIPGRYTVRARSSAKHAGSKPALASAGDVGVELRLRLSGRLAGTIVDARTGQPCAARVLVSFPDAQTTTDTEAERNVGAVGNFVIEELDPGSYDLRAVSDGGSGEVRGVRVDEGNETRGVTIRITPDGELHLRCEPPNAGGTFEIVRDGRVLERGMLRTGVTRACRVPSGQVTVRFTPRDGAAAHEQTVEIPMNGRRVVVFEKGR